MSNREARRGLSSSILGRNYERYLAGHRPTKAGCNLSSATGALYTLAKDHIAGGWRTHV